MARNQLLEARVQAAPVAPADRGRQGVLADSLAAAPITRNVPHGGKAGDTAVGGDAHAVDARSGDHRHAPRSVRAGAQAGEAVITDDHLSRQLERPNGGGQRTHVTREVGAGEAQDGDLRERTGGRLQPRVTRRAHRELLEACDACRQAHLLMRDGRTVDERA